MVNPLPKVTDAPAAIVMADPVPGCLIVPPTNVIFAPAGIVTVAGMVPWIVMVLGVAPAAVIAALSSVSLVTVASAALADGTAVPKATSMTVASVARNMVTNDFGRERKSAVGVAMINSFGCA